MLFSILFSTKFQCIMIYIAYSEEGLRLSLNFVKSIFLEIYLVAYIQLATNIHSFKATK